VLTVWDVPERAQILGSEDREFTRLLSDRRLEDVEVRTISFSHAEPSPEVLWRGLLGPARSSRRFAPPSIKSRSSTTAARDSRFPSP
jgi:hypothetical protein